MEEYSQQEIEDAKRVSILNLIQRDYPMVKDGAHWWRADKKNGGPDSLTCNDQSNLFTWWAHNEKGADTIRWMMRYAGDSPMGFREAMEFLLNWNGASVSRAAIRTAAKQEKKPYCPIDAEIVDFYHECLDDTGYDWWERRGIPAPYVDQLKLGAAKNAYTLPIRNVFDAHHSILNIKYRNKRADATPRYWQEEAHGVQLYVPHMNVLRYPYLCWAGGEIKSIVLSINGIMCASSTGGIDTWMPEWSPFLAGKEVLLLPDPGEEEQAERLLKKMAGDCKTATFCIVPLPHDPDDCLVKHDMSVSMLRHLIGI